MIQEIIKERIIKAVCEFFNTKLENINKRVTKRRKIEVIYPRQVIEYCLRTIGGLELEKAGEITGVDHATVLNSCKVISRDLVSRGYTTNNVQLPDLNPLINRLKKEVNALKDIISKQNEALESSKIYRGQIDILLIEVRALMVKYHLSIEKEEELKRGIKKMEQEFKAAEAPKPETKPYVFETPIIQLKPEPEKSPESWYNTIRAEREIKPDPIINEYKLDYRLMRQLPPERLKAVLI